MNRYRFSASGNKMRKSLGKDAVEINIMSMAADFRWRTDVQFHEALEDRYHKAARKMMIEKGANAYEADGPFTKMGTNCVWIVEFFRVTR